MCRYLNNPTFKSEYWRNVREPKDYDIREEDMNGVNALDNTIINLKKIFHADHNSVFNVGYGKNKVAAFIMAYLNAF